MADEKELSIIEGDGLISRCCEATLENAPETYVFKRSMPDTRWFVCSDCGAHWGYHRMKGKWKIDPYDYSNNPKIKALLGHE